MYLYCTLFLHFSNVFCRCTFLENVRKSATVFRLLTPRKHFKFYTAEEKRLRFFFNILACLVIFVYQMCATAKCTRHAPKFLQAQQGSFGKVYSVRSQKGPAFFKHYDLQRKTLTFCKMQCFHCIP